VSDVSGRLVILEGPDGSGKSTLSKAFTGQGFTYVHQGPFKSNAVLESMDNALAAMKQASPPVVVFDRLHLGERVYGPVFRDDDKLGQIGQVNLERWLMDRFHAMVVMCLPPEETCIDNWRRRVVTGKEMFTDESKMREVWHRYNELDTSIPTVRYDYTAHSVPELFERLAEMYDLAYNRNKGN
jgi:predicted ATPase